MGTWVSRFDVEPVGTRVAVKDAIDLAGSVTTAGCVAVRDRAVPAASDAACLAGIRAAQARGEATIVGKTTLTELCIGTTGRNDAFGTPVNPIAPDRIPGGSSSGSAVAVAAGEADVALGTDTGCSVRVPAACCGVVALKTTWGRVPLTGVWPLSPSLDTVGPIARTVEDVITGMGLLEPGFAAAATPATTVGRLRFPDDVDAEIEDAIDAALAATGLAVIDLTLDGWFPSFDAFDVILPAEFWHAHADLLDVDGVSDFSQQTLRHGRDTTELRLAQAMAARSAWRAEMTQALATVDILALPTLVRRPPLLTSTDRYPLIALTAPVNVAGLPALSMPVPLAGSPVPASLQLVGPPDGEELLCATGRVVERACEVSRPSRRLSRPSR